MDMTIEEIDDLIKEVSKQADSTEKTFLLIYYNTLKEIILLNLSYPSLN